jgi:hypothetical protein
MNICFPRAQTNIEIGDTNPLAYFRQYERVRDFDRILASHLIPCEYVSRKEFRPGDYRDFLFARAQWFAESLKAALPDVEVTIAD